MISSYAHVVCSKTVQLWIPLLLHHACFPPTARHISGFIQIRMLPTKPLRIIRVLLLHQVIPIGYVKILCHLPEHALYFTNAVTLFLFSTVDHKVRNTSQLPPHYYKQMLIATNKIQLGLDHTSTKYKYQLSCASS